MVNKPDHNCDG